MEFVARRPQAHHITSTVFALKSIKVQLLRAIRLLLLRVKRDVEVAALEAEWAGDLVDREITAALPYALAKTPPAVHSTSPSCRVSASSNIRATSKHRVEVPSA